MANILKLRAHHLLCIQGFQGYGYGQDFIENMEEVTKQIDSNPESQIITECDIICSCCPHKVEGVCQKRSDSAQKVKDMDMQVLRKLYLKDGTRGRVKDFVSLANTKLRNSFDVHDICGDCDWKEKCLWFISRGEK
ncbi:DUF1284 domain-containing protein [bacterium]|nr:DUF1284 domain-containing protein [bacterium]MCK4436513.1 DUF1284 domain-containing protein [bacterium]